MLASRSRVCHWGVHPHLDTNTHPLPCLLLSSFLYPRGRTCQCSTLLATQLVTETHSVRTPRTQAPATRHPPSQSPCYYPHTPRTIYHYLDAPALRGRVAVYMVSCISVSMVLSTGTTYMAPCTSGNNSV